MGAVYLGHDQGIDRDVAIKLIRVDDPALRRRFQSEAQSAGRLKHPNIVTVYEYGEFEGGPYLAMEFIEGDTLAGLLESGANLTTSAKLSLLIQACRGLAYAHRSGVVHRDIKPSNLMVDREGVLKIVDFGIARSANRDLTVTGKVVGTPAYMAPEQIQGDAADHRSDLFSMGLVIFEFLSGQCAFTGDSDYAIINRIVNGTPNVFRHPHDSLEPAIRSLLDETLAKDPGRRPASADLIADRLGRIQAELATGHAVPARPAAVATATVVLPATATRTRWWPVTAVAGAAVLIGAFVVFGDGLWQQPAPVEADPLPASTPAIVPPASAIADPAPMQSPVRTPDPSPESAAPVRQQPQPAVVVPVVQTPPEAPRSSESKALITAAQNSMASGDYDAAGTTFSKALAVDPSNATATQGLADARRGQERVRAAAVKSRLTEGEQKLSDGAYDDAIAIFESILANDAAHPEALDGAARARKAKAAEEAIFRPRSKKPPGNQ